MRLAFCIAIKNRSCVIVEKEDSFSYLQHVADNIVDCSEFQIRPWITKEDKVVLPLMPRMLRSLAILKKPEDDWVVVVVDYGSTDIQMKEMLQYELDGKIPWHLETVQDYDYFDRGGGLAKAAAIAESKFQAESVFFCDADILFASRDVIDKAVKTVAQGLFFYPIFFAFANETHSKGFWRDTSFGNFACKISDYKQTEGWYHNISWGWEDRALADSIPETKKVREMVRGFLHQWHPMKWEFRVKEYPVKEYVFRDAAVKFLNHEGGFRFRWTKQDAVNYYIQNHKEFYGEDGHERLLQSLKQHMKALTPTSKVLAIDVGACVGDYLKHIHELCPEQNREILSFEPNPANLPKLRSSLQQYSNVTLFPICVSDKNSIASFYNWKDMNSNEEGNLIAGLQSGGTKICDVEVKRLDAILDLEWQNQSIDIKFLKIDTEGTDTRVLKGLGKYIKNTHYIIFECSDCLDDMRGPGIPNPMEDIVKYLSQEGFDTYRIGTKKLLKVNDEYWHETYEKRKFWSNCFAIRKTDWLITRLIDSNFSYKE